MNDCYDSKCVVGVVLYVYVHVTLHVPEGILRADARRPHIILLCALKNAQRARASSRNESNVSSTPHKKHHVAPEQISLSCALVAALSCSRSWMTNEVTLRGWCGGGSG